MRLQYLPKRVRDLAAVPEPYRIAYVEDDDTGDHVLDLRIFAVVQKGESQIANLKHQIKTLAAESAAFETQRRQGAAMRQLQFEIEEAGVNPKMAPAVAALIAEGVTFEADGAGSGETAVARTPVGLKSLGALVTDFLLSDDGAGFRPPRSAPDEGRFAAMVADLKRAR